MMDRIGGIMLSSKTTGWMLLMGLVAVIVVIIAITIGGPEGTAELVAWAAENQSTWQIVVPVNMIANLLLVIFTVGFISWAKSIDQSNSAITIGKYLALLALFVIWVGDLSQVAAFNTAADNTDAAHALVSLSREFTWIGISILLASFFVVGTTAYMKKSGTPALNGLLGLVGIVGSVGSFIPAEWSDLFWLLGFVIGMVLMAIIGVQKVRS
jgi:hypothetical protein